MGQTIRVKFLVHQDGFGALTGMFMAVMWLITTEAATDAEAAPIGSLENVKVELARDFARLSGCDGLPIRKAPCFAYECLRSLKNC